ncbi:MAG: fasciclin domain-containing protein [Nitrososphaera sp.]|nr:fasciclin domain-containing protein [Nitrososphaera sp.]
MKKMYFSWAPIKKNAYLLWLMVVVVLVVVVFSLLWYQSGRMTSDGDRSPLPEAQTTMSTLQSAMEAISNPPKTSPTTGSKPPALSVVAITQKLFGTSQFNALFKSTGVAAALVGKGPYTVFVPTNGAMNQLPPGTLSGMTAAQKLRFVKYHIIIGRAIDSEAQVAGTIQAFSGDMLNFSFGADRIPMVNSAIFIEKYVANNGVVYLIDNILLPPQRL